MVGFARAALAAIFAADAVAASAEQGACPGAAEELEESALLQRSLPSSPAGALLQEAARPRERPEGFSLVTEAFKYYDADGDWRITVEDLQRVARREASYGDILGERRPNGPFTRSTLEYMIGQMDTDGSGWVSWAEFDRPSRKALRETSEDLAETEKMLNALDELTKDLSLAERTNLSLPEQLELVQQKVNGTRRQAEQAPGQAGWPWSRRRTPPVPKHRWRDRGDVRQVYTFGAPPVARVPVWNGRAGNGRFEGLRVVSSDRVQGPFWGYWLKTDISAWFFTLLGFEHPLIDALVLKKFSLVEPEHKPLLSTRDLRSWPSYNSALCCWSLHLTSVYAELAAAQGRWPVVQRMIDYSRYAYAEEAALHEVARTYGSRVVEYFLERNDSVGLIQDESTLECTLVFRGSDDLGDWVNNARVFRGETFCGFQDVHRGTVAELRGILSSDYWQSNFLTKLPRCSKVLTTGHSLGGALATLLAACANNLDVPADDDDSKLVRWKPAKPVLMKARGAPAAPKNASSA